MSDSDSLPQPLVLDALHRELGGRMVPFAGYAMPIQYEGIIAEHLWTRQNAGLFDVSHMGQVVVSGAGVDAALESLMPGDFIGLTDGRLRYSMLLDSSGGILDDLMVTRRSIDHFGSIPEFYIVVNGAVKDSDISILKAALEPKYPVIYQPELALLALQGPKAVEALSRLAPGVADLKFMAAGWFKLFGKEMWISRSGYTGEDGFEISLPSGYAESVARELLAQPEVKPIGLGARDSLRLEAGLPLYGHDLDAGTTPVTAGLAFAISKRRKTELGFPGADIIMAQLLNGPPVKRVGLAVEGKLPAREGAEVFVGSTKVGTVTSGGFAPSLNVPIAMAYVDAAYAADGTALEIEVRGKRLAATVVPMPFKPKNYVRAANSEISA